MPAAGDSPGTSFMNAVVNHFLKKISSWKKIVGFRRFHFLTTSCRMQANIISTHKIPLKNLSL